MIIGAIALPILIFILRFGWPVLRRMFVDGVEEVQNEADRAADNI